MREVDSRLFDAVDRGDVAATVTALANGADVNARSEEGASALFHAVLAANVDLVNLLLHRGADPNFRAKDPDATILANCPLSLATQARHLMNWEKYDPIIKRLEAFGAVLLEWSPDDD